MKIIKCCINCVPPKRTSECHATCPEYIEECKRNAEMRESINKRKLTNSYFISTAVKRSEKYNTKKRRRH